MQALTGTQTTLETSANSIRDLLMRSVSHLRKDYGALLHSGGYSLFFYHYGKIFEDEKSLDAAATIIENVFTGQMQYSEKKSSSLSFCAGISGSGWIATYLGREGLIDCEDALTPLDALAEDFFGYMMQRGNNDFLHGASGALYYLLSRPQSPAMEAVVRRLTDTLLQAACETDDALYWFHYDFDTAQTKPGSLNLGLAHGTPALMSILAKAQCVYPKLELVDKIRKCANTILRCRNREETGSLFGYVQDMDSPKDGLSRLGWCYGDLGVAISLWRAAEATGDLELKKEAISLLEHASHRRGLDASVKDAALCHGSAGISHIFFKYYGETGLESLKSASDYWMNITLELIRPTDSCITGRTCWRNDQGFLASFPLLEGVTGVGLAILSRLSKEKLHWDNCMMM